jgi:hypothetical protein
MFELVNPRKLIYGQKYYMKSYRRSSNIIFYGYMDFDNEMDNFALIKRLNTFMGVIISNDIIEIDIDMNDFYRRVSKEEYYAKVKEKYDRKCLNIILKRLIDESFQSDFL